MGLNNIRICCRGQIIKYLSPIIPYHLIISLNVTFFLFPWYGEFVSILAQNLSHRSSIVLPAGASLPHLHPFDPLSLRLWFRGGEAVLEELAKVNLGISFVMLIFCWPHPHSWYVYIGHFIVCRLSNRIPSNLTTKEICLVVCPVCECVCVCVWVVGGVLGITQLDPTISMESNQQCFLNAFTPKLVCIDVWLRSPPCYFLTFCMSPSRF